MSENHEQIQWSKAQASAGQDQCVEVGLGADNGDVLVRNTREPDGAVLRFTRPEWNTFKDGMKKGEPGLG